LTEKEGKIKKTYIDKTKVSQKEPILTEKESKIKKTILREKESKTKKNLY
jgi:hypothetical protein